MKIGIIGRIAEEISLLDGQTVKTRVLKQELERTFPESEIIVLETYDIRKKFFTIFNSVNQLLKKCDYIFVLLSKNGRRVFFPLIYYLNKKYKKPIYHDVIGGTLASEVEKNVSLKKYLNSFSVNWVELDSLQKKLESLGVKNASTLPNFKRLNVCKPDDLKKEYKSPYSFCTFSRVTESKGITTAANAIRYVNKRAGKKVAELHIYGEVDKAYQKTLTLILEKQKDEVFYCGRIPFDKSVETIKQYFMLLFPTTHYGEGFPGTFIDAYSAGLPIIASDWKYNTELIKEGTTGICYPSNDIDKFNDLVWYAVTHPENIQKMRINCLLEAVKYSPESVMKLIRNQMFKDRG